MGSVGEPMQAARVREVERQLKALGEEE